ncbi:MAG: acetyl-CoA acetyltransferase [Promethearchaeota archaeon CR_4]|nr:MAG: acetyl-CoA acetyltransferase [Candidatus Lokiarchaeota archaeon CR_4]
MAEPKNQYFQFAKDPKREPVLVDYIRTPIGKKNGKIVRMRGDDLTIHCVNALVDRNSWLKDNPKLVGDCIVGCNSQIGTCAIDVGRTTVLGSKLDWITPGVSLNRQCASGMQAVHFGWMEIATGEKDCVIAGGVEMQNAYPIGADMTVPVETGGVTTIPPNKMINKNKSVMASSKKYGNDMFPDKPAVAGLSVMAGQIGSAELMGHVWKAPREVLDEISYNSHMKANKEEAWKGRGKEIAPIKVPKVDAAGKVILDENSDPIPDQTELADKDEGVRPTTTKEKLADLRPIVLRKSGLLTAGNSCPTSDGGNMSIWMSRGLAEQLGVKIRATLVGCVAVGTDPILMLTGPIDATKAVMKRCETSLDAMDFIEINEAFSTVVYACCKDLGLDWNDPRLNQWGGAIAIGHPTGVTGCRLLGTLVNQLETYGKKYGYGTLCVGLGMGIGGIVKREGA